MSTGDFETTSLPHVLLGYFLWFWSCVLTQSAKSNLEAKLSSVMSTPPHSFLKAFTSYFQIYSATYSVSLYSCSPLCVWYQKRSFEGKMYDSPHLLIWSSHAPILSCFQYRVSHVINLKYEMHNVPSHYYDTTN